MLNETVTKVTTFVRRTLSFQFSSTVCFIRRTGFLFKYAKNLLLLFSIYIYQNKQTDKLKKHSKYLSGVEMTHVSYIPPTNVLSTISNSSFSSVIFIFCFLMVFPKPCTSLIATSNLHRLLKYSNGAIYF